MNRMLQGSHDHVWFVAIPLDSVVLNPQRILLINQVSYISHLLIRPWHLDLFYLHKVASRLALLTKRKAIHQYSQMCLPFALNHCMCQIQHIAKSWLPHCTVWHGGVKRCIFPHCRKSTQHPWHFSVLRYLGLAIHCTLELLPST